MESIFLTMVGILAGILVASIYSRKSLKDLRAETASIIDEFRKLRDSIAPTQPETARQITEIIQKHHYGSGAEPGITSESDACPECKKGPIKFTKYGVGPLGVNNAWYTCTVCGYQFQSHESSED